MNLLLFVIGFILGTIHGIFLIALMVVAHKGDKQGTKRTEGGDDDAGMGRT